jgi:serine phosphatase RsbU (regulator of sigma subunit)
MLGVVDCAGHGVPGAMMTMLAYSAIDQAIGEVGMRDPAAILHRADGIVRGMLPPVEGRGVLATTMDMGLAFIDHRQSQVIFSGAKMSLYKSDGKTVEILAAGRRSLVDTRRGEYNNVHTALLPGWNFYLVSDGFLDQSGGDEGFGFGDHRFAEMIQRYAALPLAAQIQAFRTTLAEYQGERAQRDDITLLCFARTNIQEQEPQRHDSL